MKVNKHDCLSCGLCGSVCKFDALKFRYNEKEGMYIPDVDLKKCTNCGLCEKTCIATDFLKKQVSDKNTIGPYSKIMLLSASENTVRKDSTSGGVVNRLISYLIKNHVIEAALMICQKNGAKTNTGYIVINETNVDILKNNPRKFTSRYCVAPLLVGLKKLEEYSKIAVVGTPCQISGVIKYEQLTKKEIMKIGIACSQGISYKATELMLKRRHADDDRVFYRGGGWPGKNTIISSGVLKDEDHLKSLFNLYYSSQIFRNASCNNCADQLNEFADISFFDYWNEKEILKERIGKSGVIIRNERVGEYITDMIDKQELWSYGSISSRDVEQSQSWAVKLKKNRKSFGLKLFLKFVEVEKNIGIYKMFGANVFMIHEKIFKLLLRD